VKIAQSTSNDWFRTVLNHLHALYEAHKRVTLATSYLGADETPISVMDEDKKGTTHRGYYWVYHNPEQKLVLFDYRPGRGREGPDDILKDFQGYLQTDGYSAYEDFDRRGGITLLHCMAHARRKFHEALENDQPRAEYALNMFQKLYAIERRIKEEGLRGDAVVQLRQGEALPVLQTLKTWMEQEYPRLVVKKSPIAGAMAYFLPRWGKLCIYTRDARLSIDNNLVENAIRPIAVGRKNYLFAGSHEAAQRAAMVYSFLATCKLHNINPYYWLRDVLENMHRFSINNLEGLLPQNWKKLPTP
jgi:transposase